MDQDLNMSVRKFLKQVGVTSQQEIERAWREANMPGGSSVEVKMVLQVEELGLEHIVEGEISGDIDT